MLPCAVRLAGGQDKRGLGDDQFHAGLVPARGGREAEAEREGGGEGGVGRAGFLGSEVYYLLNLSLLEDMDVALFICIIITYDYILDTLGRGTNVIP